MTKQPQTKRPMNKQMRNGAAVVMVTLSSASMFKAVAATATLPIVARVIRAIEITINTSMDFGTLAITDDVAARATLDPATNSLRIDGEGGLAAAGGTPRAGNIRIKGAALPVYVSMAESNVQISNGSTFLTIDNFNFNTEFGGRQVTVTPAGPDNTVALTLGASINTRARQLTGTYIGSSTIFANYQ